MPLADVLNGRMSWRESLALFRVLVNDPSSHVCAAVRGMMHPLSREGFIAADHVDAFMFANAAKPERVKPYPRPTDKPTPRMGDASLHTQDEIKAHLRRIGPRRGRARDARGRFT